MRVRIEFDDDDFGFGGYDAVEFSMFIDDIEDFAEATRLLVGASKLYCTPSVLAIALAEEITEIGESREALVWHSMLSRMTPNEKQSLLNAIANDNPPAPISDAVATSPTTEPPHE